jgi:hypothetical protein
VASVSYPVNDFGVFWKGSTPGNGLDWRTGGGALHGSSRGYEALNDHEDKSGRYGLKDP